MVLQNEIEEALQMDLKNRTIPTLSFQAGHYQWKVIKFGIFKSLDTFKSIINGILSPIIDR